MPLLIETESRTDILVAAINHVLVQHGPSGLSLRRIGRQSGVSPSSMLHHYGSREHLIRVAAVRTARARIGQIESRLHQGPIAFLPAYADDVVSLRAWLAWQELWRCEPTIESSMVRQRNAQLGMLAETFEYLRPRDDLELITAVIDGLAVELCRPERPMSTTHAQELLMNFLTRRSWWPLSERPAVDVTSPRLRGSWW